MADSPRSARPVTILAAAILAAFAFAFAFACGWFSTIASAQEPIEHSSAADGLREQVEEQRQTLETQRRQLDEQQAQLQELQRAVDRFREQFPSETDEPLMSTESLCVPPEYSQQTPLASEKVRFGYSDGFFIAGPTEHDEIADTPFLLHFNSWIQMRYTRFESMGPNPDESDFEFERAFLIFSGHAYTPDLAYHIKIDGDSDEFEGLDLLDYFVTYDLGHHQFGHDRGRFGLKAGKYKLPFHRSRRESGFALQFADRAMASDFFDINRSIGIGMFGRFELGDLPVNWETALSNGFQTQRFQPARIGELNRYPAISARVFSDLVGEWGRDGEPDLSYHTSPAVRTGAGFAYTRLDPDEGLREFIQPRVVDFGARLASLVPPGAHPFDIFLYSIDANFKYRGFSFHSEYYFRHITQFRGAPPDGLFDHGLLVQSGYFILREKLELLARWSRVVGDSGTLGEHVESADEVAGGLAWYLRGQDVKFVFDATHLNGAPIFSPTLNILPGDDGWLFRAQFQLMF